ncbi:short transient receptor potential channel 6-like isoform X2 [Bolinopsis microptera]|uniref:short transient receptor potential channel 6-like isoform X2 n=1 Tax=Bolinopsis microptera TaxID=2820187 RepID=UPI003079F493
MFRMQNDSVVVKNKILPVVAVSLNMENIPPDRHDSADDIYLNVQEHHNGSKWSRLINQYSMGHDLTSSTGSVFGGDVSNSIDSGSRLIDSNERERTSLHANPEMIFSFGLRGVSPTTQEIFKRIEANEYNELDKILSERGTKVTIVPKIGCPQQHDFISQNIANTENEEGDSPLHAAAKVGVTMVDKVLEYGGNPNAKNREGDTPLSIAAVRRDRLSIDTLIHAGASLNAAVIKLTSYLRDHTDTDLPGFESGFSVKPLTFLLSNDVYLKCRDPFRTAFDVSKSIEAIVNIRDEFRMEFELLIRDADVFAYKMLDYCEKMSEAKTVLSQAHGLLSKAINEGKKRFVGHPFSQQIILEEWYDKTISSKTVFSHIGIVVKYAMSPILLPLYFLKLVFFEQPAHVPLRNSSAADHMSFLFIPYICFVTDIFNYLILLGLLILTCISTKKSEVPNNIEIALWCCTVSRLFIECDQMCQQGIRCYLKNMWNILELCSCCLITMAAVYRIVVFLKFDNPEGSLTKLEPLHKDILNITYIYAITEFLMILRWLNFLEFFPGLGPLLIALRTLLADVFKFVLIVLFTCVVGTTIAVYSVVSTVKSQNEIKSSHEDVEIENDSTSTYVVYIILLLYIILAVVLMLNILIALLNSTFERIQGNCDIEWKYARSLLLKEYRNGQPFIFPFHLFLIPITIPYRSKMVNRRHQLKRQTTRENLWRLTERDKLLSKLCDRYRRSLAASDTERCSTFSGFNDQKMGTFAETVAVQRHNSSMRMARRAALGRNQRGASRL